MVTSPSGKGVILIGGYNADISDYSNEIIELRGTSMKWVTLSQKLLYPRYGLVIREFQERVNFRFICKLFESFYQLQ